MVMWCTEFGRMPSSQAGKGRDHNPYCFTNWLCGGGVKAGVRHGPSDEFGYKPADRKHPTEVYDIHATVLHLLGIDHTQAERPPRRHRPPADGRPRARHPRDHLIFRPIAA